MSLKLEDIMPEMDLYMHSLRSSSSTKVMRHTSCNFDTARINDKGEICLDVERVYP